MKTGQALWQHDKRRVACCAVLADIPWSEIGEVVVMTPRVWLAFPICAPRLRTLLCFLMEISHRIYNSADCLSLSMENCVNEKTIEWNLAFARDEVVEGIRKLLTKLMYPFSCSKSQDDFVLLATPPQGTLSFSVRPLMSQKSPFNIQVTLHRTLLTTTYSGFSPQMEDALQRNLTFAFLRVGG